MERDPDPDPDPDSTDAGAEPDSDPLADAPPVCPVCETAYDSVSVHDAGLMVNLLDNARSRRVRFEPAAGADGPLVRLYHHTHEQVGGEG